MKQQIITIAIATFTSVAAAFGLITYLDNTNQADSRPGQEIVVVDFMNLSQKLILNMREQFSQQDMTNPALIEMMAQSEARRLIKAVEGHSPKALILNKSDVISSPEGLDITDEIAEIMGLEGITEEAVQEFISGQAMQKPVGVK